MKKEDGFGRKLWRTVYPLLAYNGISYVVSIVATFIIIGVVSVQYDSIHTADLYQSFLEQVLQVSASYVYEIQALAALISIPIMVLFLRMDKKRRTAEGTWKEYDKVSPVLFALAIGLGLASSYVANNLMLISGLQQSTEGYAELSESFFKGNLVSELLGLGVIIPIVEELVFRGLMYERLKEFMDMKFAVITAAVCFGLVHGNVVQAVFSIFLGFLLIYVYERYHSVLAPILFHVASNVLAVFQSETGVFDVLYSGRGIFYGSTLVMCAVLVGVVVLIEKLVHSEERYCEEG